MGGLRCESLRCSCIQSVLLLFVNGAATPETGLYNTPLMGPCPSMSIPPAYFASVQEYNTDAFEKHHGVLKQTARQTNGKNDTFDRDHGRRFAHAQTLYQISSVSRSHRALLSGEITAADIRKDGVFTKALESANDATSIERPVTLSRVSAAQQTASGGPQHARMFIVVRCCGRNIWVGLMLTVSIQRKY